MFHYDRSFQPSLTKIHHVGLWLIMGDFGWTWVVMVKFGSLWLKKVHFGWLASIDDDYR